MTTDLSTRGDPRRSIALLWGVSGPTRRGPKPSCSVEEVVAAAIALADAEGLEALSMRRVAETLKLSPMSLYTYVPSKAELVDLMVDHVAEEIAEPATPPDGWRAKLENLARRRWAMVQRHPWVMDAGLHRPPLGPHLLASFEATLSALDGLGLTDMQLGQLTSLIGDYVRGAARAALEARAAEQSTGMTDDQWWSLNQPLLAGVFDPARYPTMVRVGEAYKANPGLGPDRTAAFEFGLQRVLDGIAVFVADQADARG